MPTITLDQLRAAADAKYAALIIPGVQYEVDGVVVSVEVHLRNPLRLSREARAALAALQSDVQSATAEGEEPADAVDSMREMISLLAGSQEQADAILSVVGEDAGLMAALLEHFGAQTSAGEALPSVS